MAGSGTKGWPCGVDRVLLLAMALALQHRLCHGEEVQQAAEASSEAPIITTSPHVSHQDSVEHAKSILGLTSFREGDITSEPIYASQDVLEILSSIKSELRSKHLVPKPLQSEQSYLGTIKNPTSRSDASHINSKLKIFPFRLNPDSVMPRESRTKVLKAQEPSSSKGLEPDSSVSASPTTSQSEGLVRVRSTPQVRKEEPQVQESRETKYRYLPEVGGGGDRQEHEERPEHTTTQNQDVEPTANLEISEKQLIINEKEAKIVEKEQTVDEKEPKVDEVDHRIDTKASNIGDKQLEIDKEEHKVDEQKNKTDEREAKIDAKELIMTEKDAQKELKEPKRLASLYEKMAELAKFHQNEEGGQSKQPAGGDSTGRRGGGVVWVGEEKVDQEGREKVVKVEEDKVHSEEEWKISSKVEEEEMHKGEEEKVHKEVEVKLHMENDKKVHMEEEKVHKEKEAKVHEEKEAKVHEEKEGKVHKEEEEQKVDQEEKCGSPDVQPVGGSLEVDKQFLNAIEGSSKSLVNSSTISPSRVLDDKSKFFNNQKPDTTISHIINAKEFFSHFPIKNFTYVDEQGTSSLSDSTKPEDPGIGVVKIVQPLESTSAVLEDDSTSHIVDSKHESEVEDVRKIAGEVDSLDKVKEAQEKEREEQGGKETMQAETKTDAAIDSDTTDEDGADEQEQENIDQPTADTISTAEVEKLSPIDAQSKSVDEPEQLTIIGGEEEEIKEEEIQQVEDVTSKPEINKEDISDSKRTNESTMEEKVEPTGDEKKDVEAKETTEEPPTRPEEQTPSVPDTEGEEVDQPSEPTEESEKHKKKVNETGKAVKEETQTEVDRTPEREAEKESEKEVEKKEAEKETKVDDEVEKKEAEKETEKKEPVKEDEKKESKDEESEKSADILETYSQFTQRVNAEKKNDIITNGHGNNGHGKGPKVKSKNYASPDCGSKLLTVNPEATHASKVIHANKDEYMLNKCRDKIWFTIDLCESIRPQKFDIANFELFSNLPRDLVVSGSHRYPTREWTPLAKVTGQEGNRGVQSFSIDTEDFFKYIKVEVLNHYGSEFYCPISLFRIYGLSEFEVIDTIEDSSDDHDDSEDTEALEEQDKKKVKEESKPSGIPAVLKNMLSGVLDVIKRGYRPSTSVTDPVDTCFSLNPKNAVAEHRCHLAQSLNYILSCYRTEYQDLMQKPVVSLTVKNSSFCHLLASSMCLYPEVDDSIVYDTVCNNSYICVMLSPKHVLAMCFMHDNKIMDGEVACDSARTHLPENFSATTADIISPENAIPAYVKNAKINTSSITRADAMDTTADGDPHSIKLQYKTRGTMAAEQELAKAEDTTIPRVSETPPTPKTPQKSSKACVNGDKDKQLKEPAREDNTTQPEVVPEADESGLGGLDLEAEEKEKEKEEEEFQQGEELVIPPPAPTTTTPPPPPPPPPAQAEPKVSSTSPTNKESVVVRLSNKIKALEYNMSISSQYLEELSRRYKRQMEEMQKQFNMTIAALNATSHQAFQRDQHHQRDIEALEEQLASATEALASLIASRETLANTVVEQHLLLMAVEVVLLCLVFTLCHRRSPHYHATATHARAQTPSEDGTENGVMSRREGGGCCDGERGRVRRRSVDSITRARSSAQHVRQRRPSVEALRISGTYQDLLIIEPAIPIMVDPVSDRKRKKKSSSGTLKRSKSNTSIVEKKTSCSTRRARRIENLDMSSAGVLFCGDQVETKGSPTQPSHSPHSPHSHDFSYQPFVSQEDPGCYGESGEVWSYISRVGADLEGTNEKISNPKRHSIASFHNCESSVVKKGSRLSKSLSLSATSEKFQGGTEKIKKHRKVKKTMNGVIEDRHCDPSDTPFPVPLYNHDYYCETDGPAYNNQAEHYIEYYNRGHNVVQFSKDTNGHSSHTYNDSIVGTVRIANGDNSQVIETLSSDYIHSSYEKSVIDRRKSPSATKVKKLRSDNWEWYSAQHGAGSSSETVSTCSTDSSGKHRKPNVEDKAVEKVEERSVEKGDKKVKKKKKSKVRTSVVVLEEEGETGT